MASSMPDRQPSPEDLELSLEARIARRNLTKQENYVNLLRQAQRLRSDTDQVRSDELDQLVEDGDNRAASLAAKGEGWVVSLRRPRTSPIGCDVQGVSGDFMVERYTGIWKS